MSTISTLETMQSNELDLAGIGVGPFNLSLAAVLSHIPNLKTAFFERSVDFTWHPGLMIQNSILQSSFLKDLVTPVMPTSPHSFLNYLVSHKRFYDFTSGRFGSVTRQEFSNYLSWVAMRLQSVQFKSNVREVRFENGVFHLDFDNAETIKAQNLSLGTGMRPYLPECSKPHIGESCFHASEYLFRAPDLSGKRVVIIGGGQTGAEIFLQALTNANMAPSHVTWVNRRNSFSPLEEGAFVDQIFTPNYVKAYQSFSDTLKDQEYKGQKLASDGLTPSTVADIYSELYRRTHLSEEHNTFSMRPGCELIDMSKDLQGYRLTLESQSMEQNAELDVDVVILATGAKPFVPECMNPIADRFDRIKGGGLALDDHYRVQWDDSKTNTIYALNHGAQSHGIVDAQLSLMAWRSATIANDIIGRDMFDVDPGMCLVDWQGLPASVMHERADLIMTDRAS
ncbi:SidA/IucD/PvdA family monooxygenase [Amylibacter sp. SFDW26]|uniref:lysine N(6)-hydroxylase/L-ornithine N(5)-oxygenase family protein n=1 Tax=Amylibacter sp. SFDW26 TaxID=2652722 RepID=UPI00126207BD|nr:SidA/IucD/PvdA family monooxygenase [Amylibacter sp. SFDW26]KAB7615852.1 SidA/IucD/PvdA family monooxygenase [Amylibacter sp. SFDW26]